MNKDLLKKELQHCYSEQAEHFAHTRKKSRPEMEYIAQHLTNAQIKNPVIVELGCGAGRSFGFLEDIYGKDMNYTGIDLAPGMIDEAKKMYGGRIVSQEKSKVSTAKTKRLVADMIDGLRFLPDNSVDIIMSIASVQHLMTNKERRLVWMHMYRVLQYGGNIISVNRSYSDWFLRKYKQQQLVSCIQCLLPPRKRAWNDILIPRKDPDRENNQHVWRRYYHIFSIYELQQLTRQSGFVLDRLGYILQDGTYDEKNRRASRNSLLIAKKDIRTDYGSVPTKF